MVETVEIQIRRADKYDVLDGDKLKMGLKYFVKSTQKENIYCGVLTTSEFTDLKEFSYQFKNGLIYVFVSALDNKILKK